MVTADRARRRAVLMLAALAAAMLLAGVLPWATGGEAVIRFLALPLFLAGLMVLGVTLRVWAVGRRPAPAPSAPPVERGCAGCVCGLSGTCVAASAGDGQPDSESASDRQPTGDRQPTSGGRAAAG